MSCVIILGCYRSGTSAIAGLLNQIIFMGNQFDQPNENNKKGYFEDVSLKYYHQLFDENFPPEESVFNSYKDLIKEYDKKIIWGIKDPLLCKYLNLFDDSLNSISKIIVCRRDKKQISASMSKSTDQDDPLKFIPIVEFLLDKMESQLIEYKSKYAGCENKILEINYKDVLENPFALTAKILLHIGFISKIDGNEDFIQKISEFIEPINSISCEQQ